MEALLQQLSDWLKGMLVDGIMNNLSGMFLTFIACYELIQLIIEHNNLANFETWIFVKPHTNKFACFHCRFRRRTE